LGASGVWVDRNETGTKKKTNTKGGTIRDHRPITKR